MFMTMKKRQKMLDNGETIDPFMEREKEMVEEKKRNVVVEDSSLHARFSRFTSDALSLFTGHGKEEEVEESVVVEDNLNV